MQSFVWHNFTWIPKQGDRNLQFDWNESIKFGLVPLTIISYLTTAALDSWIGLEGKNKEMINPNLKTRGLRRASHPELIQIRLPNHNPSALPQSPYSGGVHGRTIPLEDRSQNYCGLKDHHPSIYEYCTFVFLKGKKNLPSTHHVYSLWDHFL